MKLEFPEGALRPIGPEQMEQARALAAASERLRGLVRYHDHAEPGQRMLNAVSPRSYVRPHMHRSPDKHEAFIALRGRAVLCRWSDGGELEESLEISAEGPLRGAEIPPGTWHSLFSVDDDTVLYEVIDTPFDAASHKHFAPWAPEEGTPEATRFLSDLRARLGFAP